MEQLYVYKIKKKNPGEEYKGHRGIVRTVFINGKKIAVKSRLSKAYNIAKEAKFLKLLNKKGIGPKLIKYDESAIYMQFIEGSRILDYVEESKITKNQIISVFRKILLQLYEMDRQKINKRELTHPYKHIIIGKDDEPFMIDFERCYYSEKSKNITQFIQFLCSARLKYLLDKKGIAVNRDNLIISAKEYKEKKDKDIVQKIINDIK
jgi:putative serine/threonine protein kinase